MRTKETILTLALAAVLWLTGAAQGVNAQTSPTVTVNGGTSYAPDQLNNGTLAAATAITVNGTWTDAQMKKLRAALKSDGSVNTTNAVLQTANLKGITFSGDITNRMKFLFSNCTALTEVTFPDAGTIGNRVDLENIFSTCRSLEGTVDLRAFTKVSDFSKAFFGCSKLTGVLLPQTSSYEDTGGISFLNAFYGCGFLEGTIDLSGYANASSFESAFQYCKKLTAVKLGSLPDATGSNFNYTFSNTNPNCLKYLPAGVAEIPATWQTKGYGNFIFRPSDSGGGTTPPEAAAGITLTADQPFGCPEAFTLKEGSTVTYTRNFGTQTSGIGGNAAGWETICLPFTPATISGTNKAGTPVTLSPFDMDGGYEGKGTEGIVPFWLRSLGTDKYDPSTMILPDQPYIISLPNNTAYDAKFNVTGTVTFSAASTAGTPITIAVTPAVLPAASCTAYTLHSNYGTVPAAASVYVVNEEGTAYVANGGDALPFRPYVTANGNPLNAPAMFAIGNEGGGATAIEEAILMGRDASTGAEGLRVYSSGKGSLVIQSDASCEVTVYGVDGRAVRVVALQEGVNRVDGLAGGVYLVGGMKVVVE